MWLGVSMVTADHDRSRARAVVFFAGTAWDGNRFPDQHIAERLARYTQVLYVDPPLSAVRAESRRGALTPRLVGLGPSLVRLTPLAPPLPQRPGVRRVTAALARKVTRAAVRRLGWHVGVTVVASLSPFLTTFPGATRVLYGTDDFAAGAELMGVDGGWLRARQAGSSRMRTSSSP